MRRRSRARGHGRRDRSASAGPVARDPYGHGSTPVGADRDRREVTVATAIVRYVVSGTVLTVTVVRLIAF
ncbi:hypothetical protein ABZX40_39085 [Streptomyces sp. NPDC004610]|uniref:hypothetical protein n=1 Tax=unclassified Streptomyces TaxID=2593676 RepID=UPI00339F67B7